MDMNNLKVDKMRYQNNGLSYGLILLALVLSIIALFVLITPATVKPGLTTAVEIGVNILLILITFLAAEKCKNYKKEWAITAFVIAGIHILRIFLEPLSQLRSGGISGWQFTIITVLLAATAALLMIAGIDTLNKSTKLQKHIVELGE